MDDQFENVFEEHNRHRMSFHFEWTEALRIAIAFPLLFVAFFSAFGQSLQPGHLPSRKQVAPMTPAEEKNLAFVLDWWRKVIEARHTELAANSPPAKSQSYNTLLRPRMAGRLVCTIALSKHFLLQQ
jgi:hypothetical protein